MNRHLTNPYWYALFLPLILFLVLVAIRTPADSISIPGRVFIFGTLAYVTARYAGRAPRLMWEANTLPESRNIVGLGMFLVAQMMSQAYGVVYASMDRPDWLASQYYIPSFIVLGSVGLALVASSIPKFPFPPFGSPRGLGGWASVFFAVVSTLGLYLASHAPLAWKLMTGAFTALLHVFP